MTPGSSDDGKEFSDQVFAVIEQNERCGFQSFTLLSLSVGLC